MPNVQIDYRFLIAAVGGVVLLYWLGKREVKQAVRSTIAAVDPTNMENVPKTYADKVVSILAGRETTLGGAVYDVLH